MKHKPRWIARMRSQSRNSRVLWKNRPFGIYYRPLLPAWGWVQPIRRELIRTRDHWMCRKTSIFRLKFMVHRRPRKMAARPRAVR